MTEDWEYHNAGPNSAFIPAKQAPFHVSISRSYHPLVLAEVELADLEEGAVLGQTTDRGLQLLLAEGVEHQVHPAAGRQTPHRGLERQVPRVQDVLLS